MSLNLDSLLVPSKITMLTINLLHAHVLVGRDVKFIVETKVNYVIRG